MITYPPSCYSSSIIPDQIWIFESWCSWRWENWSTWRKRSQGKEENLPQTWPTWGIGSGPGIHQTIFKHMCQQLSWIIQESLGYDTNLLVSHTGHQISQIKLSYELFCALIWNLSHFLQKFEFFLIHSLVSGAFLHVFYHWQRWIHHYNHKSELWWFVPRVRLHVMS